MKRIYIVVLLIALLFSACSRQKAKETEKTMESVAATVTTPTETEDVTEIVPTEAETTIPPTVPDDLDYYEMYHTDAYNSESQTQGDEYAKEWKSTDGNISFVLNSKYGPYGDVSVPAKYMIDGKEYNTDIQLNMVRFPCFRMIEYTSEKCTLVLYGSFEYDHDEQSFTVTADNTVDIVPYLSKEDSLYDMTVEKYNDKYGDPSIPCYRIGEKVTFKMVR